MKIRKFISALLSFVTLAGVTTSCNSDDTPYTYSYVPPIYLYFSVKDQFGTNLLRPESMGTFIGQPMTVSFEGQTTSIATGSSNSNPSSMIASRAYTPKWYGGYIAYIPLSQLVEAEPYIIVGEIDGAGKYTKEVTLTLPSGEYVVRIENDVRLENGQISGTRDFYLNDVKQSDGSSLFKIVVPNTSMDN